MSTLFQRIARFIDIRNLDPLHGSLRQIKGLDGVRAFGCVLIFIFHVWFINKKRQIIVTVIDGMNIDLAYFFSQGYLGVALFFILGGFLLSLPFFAVLTEGRTFPQVYGYFLKRVFRIAPAYYAAILFFIIFSRYFPCNGCSNTFWLQLLTHLSFTHTFTERTIPGIASPMWAVGVEVHFYIVLPLLMWLLFKIGKQRLWLGLFMVSIISVYLTFNAPGFIQSMAKVLNIDESIIKQSGGIDRVAYWNVFHLFSIFFVGVVAAYFYNLIKNKQSLYINIAGKSGSVIFIFVLSAYFASPTIRGWLRSYHLISSYEWPFVPVIFAIFIFCISLQRSFLNKLLEWGPVKILGILSYGIYLYHMPVLHMVYRRIPDVEEHLITWMGISFSITLILAFFSYRYIEVPFLRRKSYSLSKINIRGKLLHADER